MEYFERKINVFEPSYAKPIYVVQGSNMHQIRVTIGDWDIPSGATVKWQVATSTKGELNTATVDGNTIIIDPYTTTFSEAGKGYLQVRIENDEKVLVSFSIDVFIHPDRVTNPTEGSNSDVIRVLVEQYVGEATGSGLTGQQWRDIISLFRSAVYDSSVLANPQEVIDRLEDSYTNIPSTSITLSASSLSFVTADIQSVAATLRPSNTTDSINAVSSNTSIASVSTNGKVVTVTPASNGTATITVTTTSGLSASVGVTVNMPATYQVTNSLTNCTNSNSQSIATEGSSYNATLVLADSSYTFSSVSVTMGGVDVTSTAWDISTGQINIASVNGDISITAVASSPVLYNLATPYVASGETDNYVNTHLYLADEDRSFTVVCYVQMSDIASNVGSNKYIMYLGKPTDNTQFTISARTSSYGVVVTGMDTGNTPKNYQTNIQHIKFVITHEAGTGVINSKTKFFDQTVTSGADDRTFTKSTTKAFVACENPMYIGQRSDGYGLGDKFTVQTLKVFNYVMSDSDIDAYIATESAEV